MRTLLIATFLSALLAMPAVAGQPDQPTGKSMHETMKKQMHKHMDKSMQQAGQWQEGPRSRSVKHYKKNMTEIHKMLKKQAAAEKKGNLEEEALLIDFPVLMVTDDNNDQAEGQFMTEEQYQVMQKTKKGKQIPENVTVKRTDQVNLLTDSLASVISQYSYKMGKKTEKWQNAGFLIKKNGQWKYKMVAEGGWGNEMKKQQQMGQGEQQKPVPAKPADYEE